MRNSPFWLFLIGIMILLDFYVFQALKVVSQSAEPRTKSIIYFIYWGLSIVALLTFLILPYLNFENYPKSLRSIVFTFIVALFFGKVITALFLMADDIRRGFQWVAGKLFF